MSELIWISDWQIQCCGAESAIGDEVTWPVLALTGTHHLGSIVGVESATTITGSYEGHEEEWPPQMRGVVRRVRTVSCRYAPLASPADQRTTYPVPGTSVIEDGTSIEKWFGTDFDTEVLRFCGWLVDLDAD